MTTLAPPPPLAATGPGPGPLTPARRAALAVGVLVSAVTVAVAAFSIIDEGTRATERLSFTLTPTGELFSVETETGNIRVTASRDDKVHVTRISEYGGEKPTYAESPGGSGDRLSARCTDGWPWSECWVSYEVAVPAGLAVRLRSDTGDVRAADLDGPLDASSATGDVEVRGVDGTLRLRSSTGGVSASGVTGDDVIAETSTGDVTLHFAEAPTAVTASTDTGDVTLLLPGGPYAVDADTDTGDTTITVPDRTGAPRTVFARTDTGDVEIRASG
ncbi:MAG TPA: DUF4097 family beta strand repeat-containing protein [Pseudonocardiaceae bacterium]